MPTTVLTHKCKACDKSHELCFDGDLIAGHEYQYTCPATKYEVLFQQSREYRRQVTFRPAGAVQLREAPAE